MFYYFRIHKYSINFCIIPLIELFILLYTFLVISFAPCREYVRYLVSLSKFRMWCAIVSYYWKSYSYLFTLYIKSFHLIFSSHFLISSNSFLISLFLIFFGKSPSIISTSWFSSGFKAFKASTGFIPCFYLFSKCFTKRRICKLRLFCYSTLIRW